MIVVNPDGDPDKDRFMVQNLLGEWTKVAPASLWLDIDLSRVQVL